MSRTDHMNKNIRGPAKVMLPNNLNEVDRVLRKFYPDKAEGLIKALHEGAFFNTVYSVESDKGNEGFFLNKAAATAYAATIEGATVKPNKLGARDNPVDGIGGSGSAAPAE